jgi:hypothetical protein
MLPYVASVHQNLLKMLLDDHNIYSFVTIYDHLGTYEHLLWYAMKWKYCN